MFKLFYYLKYTIFIGLHRLLIKDDDHLPFTIYGVEIYSRYFDSYSDTLACFSKKQIDLDIKEFIDKIDTFWLEIDCLTNKYNIYLESDDRDFIEPFSHFSFRRLVMYYAEVSNNIPPNGPTGNTQKVLTALKSSIYNWLKYASPSDRKKVLKILENDMFKFSISDGYDAINKIKFYESNDFY